VAGKATSSPHYDFCTAAVAVLGAESEYVPYQYVMYITKGLQLRLDQKKMVNPRVSADSQSRTTN